MDCSFVHTCNTAASTFASFVSVLEARVVCAHVASGDSLAACLPWPPRMKEEVHDMEYGRAHGQIKIV